MTNEQGYGGFTPREIIPVKKEVPISAESLLADNRSSKAQQGITIWHENSAAGRLIQSDTCSDSRQEVPDLESAVIVQSISTAGSKEEYRGLINNRAVRAAANVAHHAGNTVMPKAVPTGCGG